MIYFELFDDPRHTGYFSPAERNFGLVTSDGRAKPSLEMIRSLTR